MRQQDDPSPPFTRGCVTGLGHGRRVASVYGTQGELVTGTGIGTGTGTGIGTDNGLLVARTFAGHFGTDEATKRVPNQATCVSFTLPRFRAHDVRADGAQARSYDPAHVDAPECRHDPRRRR